MTQENLLIEIGTEELPPKALKKLSDAFTAGIVAGLEKADLAFGEVVSYAAPRRLAVMIKSVDTAQADKEVERKGPACAAPEQAVKGFAGSCGVSVDDLEKIDTPKGQWYVFRQMQKGQATAELIPAMVEESLAKLPIPKRMRWGDKTVEFVRPVHWIVMMQGESVIEGTVLDIPAGRETQGHRFHHPDTITINKPETYAAQLQESGFVYADFEARRAMVKEQAEKAAQAHGGTAVIDEDLLDEVTSLVEWPVAVVGEFDKAFLDVPSECLISAMKGHQKYFHMVDANGQLMPNFITMSNIQSTNLNSVKEGNERVIAPRLKDADFFWNQDKKKRLEDYLPALKTVVFQKQLGTTFDKVERVETLAGIVAKALNEDVANAQRAARLSKCDLMTDMVGEFPELQGIMGRYYALNDDEHANVAEAIDDQYKPRFAGDNLPETAEGRALAIADKLDTITGIYGIGQVPTGDKDPFALRRAALGVLRIMIECELDLDLKALIAESLALHDAVENKDAVAGDIYTFMMERLRAYFADQGFDATEFEAVMAISPAKPMDFAARLKAVKTFGQMPEAESLAAANKRIQNILKKNDAFGATNVDASLFEKDEESNLSKAVSDMMNEVDSFIAQANYASALQTLAGLREQVDAFFDNVMVMADDEAVKNNRLALLNQLSQRFMQVADISKLSA